MQGAGRDGMKLRKRKRKALSLLMLARGRPGGRIVSNRHHDLIARSGGRKRGRNRETTPFRCVCECVLVGDGEATSCGGGEVEDGLKAEESLMVSSKQEGSYRDGLKIFWFC